MGIISDVLSRVSGRGDEDSVEGVQAALERVKVERENANNAIRSGYQRRAELLVKDGTDKQILAIDVEHDRLGLVLERLEAVEESLFGRLQTLRSQRRLDEWATRAAKFTPAARGYIAAVREAGKKLAALVAIADSARSAGFEAEVLAGMPFPPNLLNLADTELIDQFEGAVERVRDLAAARSAGPARVAAPIALPVPPKAPRKAEPIASPLDKPAAPRKALTETAGPGEIAVRVLRPGLESPSGKQTAVGDIIAMPAEMAAIAAANGAVEPQEARQ